MHFVAGNERIYAIALDFQARLTLLVRDELSILMPSMPPAGNGDMHDLLEALVAHHTMVALQVDKERHGGIPRAAALLNAVRHPLVFCYHAGP